MIVNVQIGTLIINGIQSSRDMCRCPEAVEEVFIEGTEPTDYCAIHGGGLWERFKRSLGL